MVTIEPTRPDHGGLKCHAGSGHEPARSRGAFGDLCDACWDSMRKILERILGREVPA